MRTTARDVMTKDVITVTPSTPLGDVARMFAEDRISGAPVVDATDRLVGIVSRTDVITGLLEDTAESAPPVLRSLLGISESEESEEEDGGDVPEPEAAQGLLVEDVMDGDPPTAAPAAALVEVAKRMARERIHRVVVVEGDRVVGILTSIDVLGRFPNGPRRKPARAPARPAAKRAGSKPPARKAARPAGRARKAVKTRR
jgi:CBS domain-containing protein